MFSRYMKHFDADLKKYFLEHKEAVNDLLYSNYFVILKAHNLSDFSFTYKTLHYREFSQLQENLSEYLLFNPLCGCGYELEYVLQKGVFMEPFTVSILLDRRLNRDIKINNYFDQKRKLEE